MEFKKTLISSLLTLLYLIPGVVHAFWSQYDRMIDLKYANGDTANFPWSEDYFYENVVDVFKENPLTAITPLFLNTLDPMSNDTFANIIGGLQNRSIVIFPAIGEQGPHPFAINSVTAKNIAIGYRKFTNAIKITDAEAYWKASEDEFNDMLDFLINNQTFAHIGLDSWPGKGGQLAPFTQQEIDWAGFQVFLDFDPETHMPIKNKSNWKPHEHGIDQVYQLNPNAYLAMGYEEPPQQQVLANLGHAQQIGALTTTINAIAKLNAKKFNGALRWAPPFSPYYNPILEHTWNEFIVPQVEMEGSS